MLGLGRAAASVLALDGKPFLIGRDTRLSGPMLESALAAGLASEGVDVALLGILPTPAVAWSSAADGCPAAVISASHNPFSDNGIKFFTPGGRKLDDATETRLEKALAASTLLPDATVGSVSGDDRRDGYVDALVATLEGRTLDGLHVVLDCAQGAGFEVAPQVLRQLGARVDVLFDQPSGTNINDGCGSTHPQALQAAVVERGADAGLALDGDADRVLAVDHRGELVDGDQILAVCALDLRGRRALPDDTVVVTVMSNLGFRVAMDEQGISIVETPVGDRNVLEALEDGGFALGGEQSGHVIFRRLATTGDGILTGIQLLDTVARSGRPLAELAAVMTRLPQVLRNVQVAARDELAHADGFWEQVRSVEADLGKRGRVLVRPSGTEPLVRVMVEASTTDVAERAADQLCAALADALGRGTT